METTCFCNQSDVENRFSVCKTCKFVQKMQQNKVSQECLKILQMRETILNT